jgi:hypothetical protein
MEKWRVDMKCGGFGDSNVYFHEIFGCVFIFVVLDIGV